MRDHVDGSGVLPLLEPHTYSENNAALQTKASRLKEIFDESRHRSAERSRMFDQLFRSAAQRIERSRRGWTPLTDAELNSTSRDDRERARKARNARDAYRRKKEGTTGGLRVPLAVTHREFTKRLATLRRWLALPGHHQRHLRGAKLRIMRAWLVSRLIGPDATATDFATEYEARFKEPMTRAQAQKRFKLLTSLRAETGPWSGEVFVSGKNLPGEVFVSGKIE